MLFLGHNREATVKIRDIVENPEEFHFDTERLGESMVDTPLGNRSFVDEDARIVLPAEMSLIQKALEKGIQIPSLEKAGSRRKIYHPPFMTRAAIVTCGGLCPGLNTVIKGLVHTLIHEYDVRDIYGIPYGYQGLNPEYGHRPIVLTHDLVDTIHMQGGSILGSSRGPQDPKVMVDTLVNMRVNLLFTIGGDGTQTGASLIAEEIKRRKLDISVVGIPKTVDNDIHFVGQTFGFETAIYTTNQIITSAHAEAESAHNGLGLVKLMGRDSGFIAAYATLANPVVNICLIPEDPFELEGPNGLLKALERRFRHKQHAVVVVAEGAGQHLFAKQETQKDASGNLLKQDIGQYLVERITEFFKEIKIPLNLKYFDPSYLVRSVPAIGTDQIFCLRLAENAVHAAMAGRTNVVVGYWNREFVHVPIPMATRKRQKVDVEGELWQSVLASTRQGRYFYKTDK
jgi:6-phosphofructokinase 1